MRNFDFPAYFAVFSFNKRQAADFLTADGFFIYLLVIYPLFACYLFAENGPAGSDKDFAVFLFVVHDYFFIYFAFG